MRTQLQPKAISEEDLNKSYIEVMQVRLGQKVLLIPVPDVSEIVHTQPLTPVPMAPDHLLGLCNIHGQAVCVIDPCRVMSLPPADTEESTEHQRFIVLSHPKMHLAIRAEEIQALLQLNEDEFKQATQHVDGFFYDSQNALPHPYPILYTEALFK